MGYDAVEVSGAFRLLAGSLLDSISSAIVPLGLRRLRRIKAASNHQTVSITFFFAFRF